MHVWVWAFQKCCAPGGLYQFVHYFRVGCDLVGLSSGSRRVLFYEALESLYLASALIVPEIVPDPLLHDTQIICASRKKDVFVL